MDASPKRAGRKRRHERDDDTDVPLSKSRPFDDKARMEEEELAKDLFGDNLGFLKSLEEVELFPAAGTSADSGVGETETECESSSDELKRKPAWVDEDDDGIDVGNALHSQNRNLPAGGANDKRRRYADLLQDKYKAVVGTPRWAKLDKKPTGDDSDDEVLQSCGHLAKSAPVALPSTVLDHKKVRDLNAETYSEGPLITAVEFHPNSTVALVAGVSGVASIFAVDGRRNSKLHSVAFAKYPIECARFLHGGTEAVFGSHKRHMFAFDLMAAKASRIYLPDGLTHSKLFEVDRDSRLMAVAGRWGEVHLLATRSKELLTTLKQNSEVTALAFDPTGSLLFGHSDMGEVTVWNLAERKVVHKFYDEGCIRGTAVTVSPSGHLMATGSAQGVVNLYRTDQATSERTPRPRKSVLNLTTSISSLRFNCTSELLGFASNEVANSVRLLHTPSGTVFKNFPQFGTRLGRVNYLNFSPAGGYAAFANRKATVALYRLKHYNNY